MSVWFAIPSKRPPAQAEPVLKLWRERGYKIALWCDSIQDATLKRADYYIAGRYPGYGAAVNALAADILGTRPTERPEPLDRAAQWIVTGGDDVEPDPNHTAEEIAYDCGFQFAVERFPGMNRPTDLTAGTFGVMQPTGDRWGDEPWSRQRWPNAPAYIDRICGSPWLGREFCRRMYGGRGPLCEEYRHMYVDEELQNVALKLGVLWQRRDLTHLHRHWGRKPGATAADVPDFLKHANSESEWAKAKAIFDSRKANGFPGHEPIA